jgi:hypothetical protein
MGYARQRYNAMPAVWRVAKFETSKRRRINLVSPVTASSDGFPER